MKKLVLGLLFGIFLINSVIALDCQYKKNNPYFQDITSFYENGTKLSYNLLELSNIKPGSPGGGWYGTPPTNTEFTILNNYNSEINVTINYLFNGVAQTAPALIAPKGYFTITCPGISGLDESSISFDIKTAGLEAKRESTKFDNYSCTQCPDGSGFICLNDGQNCTDSSQCGGAYCVRGYCSHSDSCFNNDCKCASDEIQCGDNTQCVKKNSVQLGFKPVCRFEECITGYLNKNGACALKNGEKCGINDNCASGICNANYECGVINDTCKGNTTICNATNKCVIPSVKKTGEAYACDFECKSLRGKNGICLRTIEWWVCFWVICIIITSAGVWAFAVWQRNKAKNEKEKAEKKRKEAEEGRILAEKKRETAEQETINILLDLKKKKEAIDKKITDVKLRYDKKEKELNERLKKADVLAQAGVEREIKEERRRREKELNSLKESKEENENERIRQENIKEVLKDSRIKQEAESKQIEDGSYNNYIQKQLNLYKKKYETPSIDVYYDKNEGYLGVKEKKTNKIIGSLQRYVYKKEVDTNVFGKEIHHIDYDVFNNEIWNLIALKEEDHNKKYEKFRHGKLKKGEWLWGYEQLKEQLGMKEEDFPEHIKKHLRELKEQKKLV